MPIVEKRLTKRSTESWAIFSASWSLHGQLPDHLAPVLLAWLGGSRWRVLGMDGAAPRLSDLMRKYADRPMQIADASMIWAAEHTELHQIITLDRADFDIYRTKTGKRLEILP